MADFKDIALPKLLSMFSQLSSVFFIILLLSYYSSKAAPIIQQASEFFNKMHQYNFYNEFM